MADTRRPKRQCASRKAAAPSAVHYVGYVEDDETPEMIMRKFEELEKVKALATEQRLPGPAERSNIEEPARDQAELAQVASPLKGLTDEQLLEVFKQTSIFNVRSALAGNDSLMEGDAMELGFDRWSDEEDVDDEGLWNDVRGFWSDDEDADYRGHWKKAKGKKGARIPGFSHSKPRHDIVTSYNTSTRALIRKKIRVFDKDALVQVKIPYPLPLSWGRTVKPYEPAVPSHAEQDTEGQDRGADSASASHGLELASVLDTDWNSLGKDYQAVMINPGWEVKGERGQGAVRNYAKLPIPRLCPRGFVFIWVQKEHISAVMQQMSKWGFIYVENLTWVYLHHNNNVLRLPSDHVRRSHLTLFLFRREGQGKDIELRHQRKPDVVFDTVRSSPGQEFEVPEEAYTTIEILLPSGMGKFLELWARRRRRRSGWTHVAESPRPQNLTISNKASDPVA